MNRKFHHCAIAAFSLVAVAVASSPAQAAPILLTNASGLLTGATSVDVNGALYDVDFRIGSYWQYGADAVQNRVFDSAGSVAASMALLQQVFVDGPAGNFDSNPAATITGSVPVFTIYTAHLYTGVPVGYYAWNTTYIPDCYSLRGCDMVGGSQADLYSAAYAFWTPHVSSPTVAVPEPATLASLALGLVALGAMRRRRKQA